MPNHLVPSFTFMFMCSISSIISTMHACNIVDHDSLKSSFDLPHLNWSSSDCCHWEGISCDENGRVKNILLPFKGLQGKISPSLGNLTQLSHLNLSHNQLLGPLGKGLFSSLSHLQVLDLSYNHLSATLPTSISSDSICIVDLSNNLFDGTTPSSFLQHAVNLRILNISDNLISGNIPSSICLSSSFIEILDFSKNKFSDVIPIGIGNCSKLEVFRAGFNNLSGSLPSDLYDALSLQEISLPSSRLSGSISEDIVNLSNLTILEIYFNQLSGTLPSQIGKLSKLKLMLLHFNNLQGFLPSSLMSCTNLVELILGYNHLEGNISLLDFSKLGKLAKLDLASNHFTGVIPTSLYSCKSLGALRLSFNDIEAQDRQIQPEMLALESLSFLALSRTRLTNVTGALKILKGFKNLGVVILWGNFIGEELPSADEDDINGSMFKNLRLFGIGDCQLTGQIPRWLSNLKKLEAIDLSSNRLSGSIPAWLGDLPSLFFISLNNNSFSGEIPKELSRLQALQSQRAAPQGHGYFELPVYTRRTIASVTDLQYNYISNLLRAIYLRNSSLSGNIPYEIGHLQLLHEFDLSINNLERLRTKCPISQTWRD